ncbi:MAG: beta-ketoacyl-ACP synthase II [Anaerolineae bacterium]
MNKRVVVTGLGALSPVGNTVDEVWSALINGQSGITEAEVLAEAGLETRFAGLVKEFDPVDAFGRKEARRMDRVMHFAMEVGRQALDDSRLLENGVDRNRIGVTLSSAIGGVTTLLKQYDIYSKRGARKVSPFMVPMILADSPAARLAIEYGFRGPSMSIVSACATGTNALGEAFEMIARGSADALVAGGADAAIHPMLVAGFNMMGALSTRNDDPASACRPFDATRDGFVISEGAVSLVLEELEHAKARGAHIYGEVIGYGTSVDANHMAAPLDSGEGASLAMQNALRRAGIEPTGVDYLNAHGTSTRLNDKSETLAIKTVLGEHAYNISVSSTKSMTGHLLGGAGALESLACLKALEEGIIPPTINYETPDPECDLDCVPNQARRSDIKVALSNSFGFGGHNASLIFRKYE